jgi:hypothetical protein
VLRTVHASTEEGLTAPGSSADGQARGSSLHRSHDLFRQVTRLSHRK